MNQQAAHRLSITPPAEAPKDPPKPGWLAPVAATDSPLLVDAIEAARLLGISPRTLWTLTQSGEVRCKRVGRRVLYSRQALKDFADGK